MFTDRPSRWQSLPASIAAMMPPSLISLSDTPPAPAFALVVDVGERMDALVDADRHLGAAREFLQALDVVIGERLLDEHQPRFPGLLDIAARVGQRQPAIGVGAERRLRQRLAHREGDGDFLRQRLHADLELEEVEAFLLLARGPRRRPPRRSCCRGATSASRRCGAGGRRDRSAACRRRGRSDRAPPSRPPNARRRCRAARDAAPAAAPASRGRPCRSASAPDGRARPRPARPACRRSWSAPTPLRPSRRVPSAASIRTSRFCAAVMVSADIFIGVFSGNATGMASTRRMTSGA